MEESKPTGNNTANRNGRRVFGVVLRGDSEDFQRWLDAAKVYDVELIFSMAASPGKRLTINEEPW